MILHPGFLQWTGPEARAEVVGMVGTGKRITRDLGIVMLRLGGRRGSG